MKKALIFVFLFSLLSVPCASAEDATPKINERELQNYFSTFASAFGCTKNSFSRFSSINLGEMEFLPPDQRGVSWRNLYTVVVQILPYDPALIFPAIHGYSSSMLKNYAEHARIIDTDTKNAKDGTPVIYIEYKLRSGLLTEHGVGVYGRHTESMAAFTRYEVRGRLLNDQEKSEMKKLADMLVKR
jgi:hypothetical protein